MMMILMLMLMMVMMMKMMMLMLMLMVVVMLLMMMMVMISRVVWFQHVPTPILFFLWLFPPSTFHVRTTTDFTSTVGQASDA